MDTNFRPLAAFRQQGVASHKRRINLQRIGSFMRNIQILLYCARTLFPCDADQALILIILDCVKWRQFI